LSLQEFSLLAVERIIPTTPHIGVLVGGKKFHTTYEKSHFVGCI